MPTMNLASRTFPCCDHPAMRQLARRAAKQLSRIADKVQPAPSFILAIVVEGLPRDRLETEIARVQAEAQAMPLQIDLRVYDFGELKEKYGVTSSRT